MLRNSEKIIRRKVGLLSWVEELGNVSNACQVMGFSRDAFYRYKNAPNLKNPLDPATEAAVIADALAYPAHDRANFKQRLKALKAKVAGEGRIMN